MSNTEPVKRYSTAYPGSMFERAPDYPATLYVLATDYDRDIEALEDEVGRLRGVVSRMVKRSDYNDQAKTIERLRGLL